MSEKIIYPEFNKNAFHCPHCGVYAKQNWCNFDYYPLNNGRWKIARCEHCNRVSIWGGYDCIEQLFPLTTIDVEKPNEDLNENIKKLYWEAAEIKEKSPRAAAALLRLALQELCKQLGEQGKNINNDIGELVKKGLTSNVQKALDSLRIVGNNAVHPGEIDFDDNILIVNQLFTFINFIASQTLTKQKEIDDFYSKLPKTALDSVAKRDDIS